MTSATLGGGGGQRNSDMAKLYLEGEKNEVNDSNH